MEGDSVSTDPEDSRGSSELQVQEQPSHPENKSWKESLEIGETEGDDWKQKVFKVLFPLTLPFIASAILLIFYSWEIIQEWLGYVFIYLVPPAGKETVIPWMVTNDFPIWSGILAVVLMDVMCALLIVWNYSYLKQIPYMGGMVAKIEAKGRAKFDSSDSAKGGAWLMLVLIVMIPFQGSGGISSALIGRAVGMRPLDIITAVVTGGVITGTIIGVGAKVGVAFVSENPIAAGILVIVVAAFVIVEIIYHKKTKAHVWSRKKAKGSEGEAGGVDDSGEAGTDEEPIEPTETS